MRAKAFVDVAGSCGEAFISGARSWCPIGIRMQLLCKPSDFAKMNS